MSGMMWGRTPSGQAVKIQVTDAGAVVVAGTVGGGGAGGTSDTLESTQQLVKIAVQNIDVDLGAATDAPAASDTGAAGLIALIKRSLQNWTALLARIPALTAGRTPVDGSGVTQPISAVALPLPAGAATAAKQDTAAASLSSIDGKTPTATGTITTLLGAVTATGAGASATPGARTFGIVCWGTTTSGTGAATIAIQASHDGASWVTIATVSLTLGTTATGDAFGSPVPYKYLRANVTALSGTGAAVTATLGV